MKFELRNANFSWPKWQAVIMTFFAPWLLMNFHFGKQFLYHIFHVAKKVEVTNILDSISGYSLNNFFQREKHVPSRHFHKTDMFNSTHFCICNIKWSKVFTIIFFPKKQTQPKLPLFAALSELIVVTLKSIFQCKKATFAH